MRRVHEVMVCARCSAQLGRSPCVRRPARHRRVRTGRGASLERSALRSDCPAMLGLVAPSQNSLRSLRSLRSNSRGESEDEARCARRPQACAARRHRNRPRRVPPAARQRLGCLYREPNLPLQRRVRAGRGAPLGRREAQGSWPRAQRELSTDSSRLFERSERSERSEFCDGATRPSIAGQSERSADRSSEAPRPVRTRLCRADSRAQGERPSWAQGLEQTATSYTRFMCCGSGEAVEQLT